MAKKTTAKPGAKNSNPGKPAMKYVQTRLTEQAWKDLQSLRIEETKPLQTLIVEALNDLMVKYGKKPTIAGPSEDEK
jgi:hypothetical protein